MDGAEGSLHNERRGFSDVEDIPTPIRKLVGENPTIFNGKFSV